MSTKPKLNDLQLILLSHAANTDGGSVLPLPDTVTDQERAHKELKSLLRRGLLTRVETTNTQQAWRSERDLHIALLISSAGLAALGLAEDAAVDEDGASGEGEPAPNPQPHPRATSKIAGVITLLQRQEGASLAELVDATGWQPHTTRAALTGLRKKGHAIAKTAREGTTVYHIGETA